MNWARSSSDFPRGEQWTLALSLFDRLCFELQPDVVSYNAAISACEPWSRWWDSLVRGSPSLKNADYWANKTMIE